MYENSGLSIRVPKPWVTENNELIIAPGQDLLIVNGDEVISKIDAFSVIGIVTAMQNMVDHRLEDHIVKE